LLPPVAALGLDGTRLQCGADFRDEGMAGFDARLKTQASKISLDRTGLLMEAHGASRGENSEIDQAPAGAKERCG
jgi:hypothetical protein